MQITWVKPPKGGFIFKDYSMDKKKVIVYVDGYNFYYGLKHGGNKCDNIVWLEHYKARFVQSMLPEELTLPNGHKITRPENWK